MCFCDGAFDTNDLMHLIGARPVIKVRKNASSAGDRRQAIRGYQSEWADQEQYGMRWPGTEGIFSAVKFGENCVSRCITGLEAEGYQRFWAYYMNQRAKQLVKAMN